MNDNTYKILDDLLDCFNAEEFINGNSLTIKITDISKHIGGKSTYNSKVIVYALFYLIKEGYLSKENSDTINDDGLIDLDKSSEMEFALTFDGYMLIKNGGYRSKMAIETSSSVLNWVLTVSIAVGTFLAGVYAVTQLYDWFYSHGCQFWFAK